LDRSSLRALVRVADVPVAIAVAFALYALGIWVVVAEANVMPVGLRRILEVQRHLAEGSGPSGGVAVLGSSVVVEGVDCTVLARQLARGTACENLAWTGGNLRQWLMIEPALRKSPPRVLALGLDLFSLLDFGPLPPDRLAIAGWWRFVPEADLPAYRTVLNADELSVLEAERLSQLLRFRSFPLATLNEYVREVARSDLRYQGYATNFEAPWARLRPASAEAMQKHIEQNIARIRNGGVARLPETEQTLAFFIARVREANPDARFALVLTPVHPRLAAALGAAELAEVRNVLRARAARLGAVFLDHSMALPAEGFSDAVHPFAEGRNAWSRELGDALAMQLR
jgi:hypothetical protein